MVDRGPQPLHYQQRKHCSLILSWICLLSLFFKENIELLGKKSDSQSYWFILHTSNCLFTNDLINNTFSKQKSWQSLQSNADGKGNF